MTTDERISQLEERLTWLQRHVTDQDLVISEQMRAIELLKKHLSTLHARLPGTSDGDSAPPAEERPPHY